jgi:hypothetical protein
LSVIYCEEHQQHGCFFFLEEEIDDGRGAFTLVIP